MLLVGMPRLRTLLTVLAYGLSMLGPVRAADDLNAMSHDEKQWVMAPKDYANTRYSGLDHIKINNVGRLQLAWSFSTGADRGQEAAPLVVNNTMYVVGPSAGVYPNRVFALDATTGDLKWSYAPKPNFSAQGVACCDVVTRGLGYDNNKVFLATLDDFLVAIDANDGHELWHTTLGDINLGETVTMAPLVIKGKVLVGNSGGELGVRGWVTAVDEDSGKIAWRAYATGPDEDVRIGGDFKPFYKDQQGKDLGVTSWPPDKWRIGGGTMWGWIQYDPEANPITAPAIPHRGTRISVLATTCGRQPNSHAIRTTGWPGGPISTPRTMISITTRSTRAFC
jgi:lanthanide-dependent methanol dehydrogenase